MLTGVSFSIQPGEFVALTGPNGAGKSTLLRILLGLLTPTSGTVRLFGAPPAELSDRQRIGYVPQRTVIADDLPATVEEVVASGLLNRRSWWRRGKRTDRDQVDHALTSVAMIDRRHRRVTELSGGQQQRVLIAKALTSDPELLILDEPTTGIDAESQERFRQTLVHLAREHGGAVLLVSHELSAVADDLDRVLVLKGGRIRFDGSPSELVATGVSLGLHQHDLPVWLEG